MIGFKGAVFDSRKVEPGMLFVALEGEHVDGHDYIEDALARGAAGVVDGLDELHRLAGEYRRSLKAKVIGVTGSAGKTTTKELGDLILPLAAIRGEGTSNDYLPAEVPALPAFMLQRAVSSSIRDMGHDYWTGTVYSTNRRIWEHDEGFKEFLRATRAMAVDMETATLFVTGFANRIPTGALLLVSDQPMTPEGVKTEKSDNLVTQNYVNDHLNIGIASLRMIIDEKKTVKHLKFDW